MHKILYFSLWISLVLLSSCESNSDTEADSNTESMSSPQASDNKSENASEDSSDELSDYLELDADMNLGDYLGQKVRIEGTIADPRTVDQHMMKSAPPFGEPEKHVFINYNNGEQTTAYYKNLSIPENDAVHYFYGTVGKISGPGKGGGSYTEFYIDVEKVD